MTTLIRFVMAILITTAVWEIGHTESHAMLAESYSQTVFKAKAVLKSMPHRRNPRRIPIMNKYYYDYTLMTREEKLSFLQGLFHDSATSVSDMEIIHKEFQKVLKTTSQEPLHSTIDWRDMW